MSDTTFFSGTTLQTSIVRTIGTRLLVLATAGCTVLREWRHNYISRRELALYSHHERNDLSFAAEVDSEIAKPFWKE